MPLLSKPLISKQNIIYAAAAIFITACFSIDVIIGICVLVLGGLAWFWYSNHFSLEPDMPPRPGIRLGNSRGKF